MKYYWTCIIIIIIIHTLLWHWLDWLMRNNYAICVKWTKLSEIENRSLSMQLLHAVKTIKLKLCIKFVPDNHMLKNECSCYSELFQKLCFHYYSYCHLEILRDRNNDLIVHDVNVIKHSWSKMRSIEAVH
jgi:hypothetical protein